MTGTGEAIGSGWGGFTALLAPGDFSGDGKPDILARRSDGALLLYRGNGDSGFAGAPQVVGSGWQTFTALLGPGDWNGDGKVDVLARASDGTAAALPRQRQGRLDHRQRRADRHRLGWLHRADGQRRLQRRRLPRHPRPRVRRPAPALPRQRIGSLHRALSAGRLRLAVAEHAHAHRPGPPPAAGAARAPERPAARRPRAAQRRRPLRAARRPAAREPEDPQAQGPQAAARPAGRVLRPQGPAPRRSQAPLRRRACGCGARPAPRAASTRACSSAARGRRRCARRRWRAATSCAAESWEDSQAARSEQGCRRGCGARATWVASATEHPTHRRSISFATATRSSGSLVRCPRSLQSRRRERRSSSSRTSVTSNRTRWPRVLVRTTRPSSV